MTIPLSTLGTTGITVPKLAIGTWGFGPVSFKESQVKDDEALAATLTAAFDAGLRYLDLAESYENEARVGRILETIDTPDDLVFASKAGISGNITESYTADHVRRSVERSLEELGLDRLPLFLLHDPRNDEHMGEILGAAGAVEGLRRLQDEGLVGSIGVATASAEPLWTAVRSGEFDVIQMPRLYSLLSTPALDSGLLAAAKEKGMGTILAAPFGGGGILITGAVPGARYMLGEASPEILAAVQRMQDRCAELGITIAQAALAYTLTEPLLDLVIVGLAKPEEVAWNAPAASLPVTRAELEEIRELGRLAPEVIGGPL